LSYLTLITLSAVDYSDDGFEWYRGDSDLKILVININLTTLIIYKNGPSIINTASDITFVLYFCKITFKDYYF